MLGKTDVFVDGFYQSSGYVRQMWRKALWHVPHMAPVKTVFMLGLGGGSAVRELRRKFRGCAITVVEWDPEMVALYHELNPNSEPITVLEGDATVLVPAMSQKFDLVIVDLFKGNETPKQLGDHPLVSAIANAVAPDGYCLLNAFVSLDLPRVFDQHLSRVEMWRYQFNTLLLYRKM